jgi:hypothetical protein
MAAARAARACGDLSKWTFGSGASTGPPPRAAATPTEVRCGLAVVGGRDDGDELAYCIDAVVLGREDREPVCGWVEPGEEEVSGRVEVGDAAGRGEAAGGATSGDVAGEDTRGMCASGERGDAAATTAAATEAAVGDTLTDEPPHAVVVDTGMVRRKGTAPFSVFGDGNGEADAVVCGDPGEGTESDKAPPATVARC